MPISTLTRRVGTVVAGIVAAIAVFPAPVLAAPATPTQLNATDTLLLNGVRLAGLWEMPAGQMAVQKGSTARIRQVGQMIADQHIELDELTVAAANKLGATIPATATDEQQGWLKEMQDTTGRQFDQTFVTRLRAAHGKIFPVISAVRSSTRNPVVRELADQANIFVMNHMQMLESTGLVEYNKLPPAALPPAEDISTLAIAQANAGSAPPVNPVVLLTSIATLGVAIFASFRLIRGRRPSDARTWPTRG